MRETGVVKFFDDQKGWGFITRGDDTEAFVHYSEISARGHRSLIQGQRVEFKAEKGPRGWAAKEVIVIG